MLDIEISQQWIATPLFPPTTRVHVQEEECTIHFRFVSRRIVVFISIMDKIHIEEIGRQATPLSVEAVKSTPAILPHQIFIYNEARALSIPTMLSKEDL